LQRAWWRPSITLPAALLLPLSWMFGVLSAMRRAAYRAGRLRRTRLPVPVVIVGNIAAGGSGKTPLVIALAGALRERGFHPGIVSRGHGRRDRAPRVVLPGDRARDVGDEPPILAASGAPVCVGRSRAGAAGALLAAHPEVDVIVCDDGLQHYALDRDVEIAVVDGARGNGNGLLLPAGPLREPVSRLASVDALVELWTDDAAVAPARDPARPGREARVGAGPGFPGTAAENRVRPEFARRGRPAIYRMTQQPQPWRNVADPAIVTDSGHLRGPDLVAIAGIGNPQRFFDQLERLGLEPRTHTFGDHHHYRRAEVAFPGARAILMTEKDAVKCREFGDPRMWMLPIRASIDPALIDAVVEKLRGSQAARNARVPGDQGPTDP
ncbi:MAG TPA: tetraacyldisaccharide 4'-kinase, partial [Casimicrobiaceae bacterium]|nr:tetraacyldisaccharide 4'-kinase [Casimicrobiaceae bacterium]